MTWADELTLRQRGRALLGYATRSKATRRFNKDVANASKASDLRAVRFNVVTRTRSEDDRFTQGFFQATENRGAVAGQDGYRRRVHTAIVRMRNIGDRVGGT